MNASVQTIAAAVLTLFVLLLSVGVLLNIITAPSAKLPWVCLGMLAIALLFALIPRRA